MEKNLKKSFFLPNQKFEFLTHSFHFHRQTFEAFGVVYRYIILMALTCCFHAVCIEFCPFITCYLLFFMYLRFNAAKNAIKAPILKSHEKYELSLRFMNCMCKLCMEVSNFHETRVSMFLVLSLSFLCNLPYVVYSSLDAISSSKCPNVVCWSVVCFCDQLLGNSLPTAC